jgi:hypothetical protein
MSWKKVGGIDYSKSHQNVRIQNSTMSLASVINQFGETGTNTKICSNLVLDTSASFLSYKNELDTTNLGLYYKFDQKVDNSGNNTYTDTRQITPNPVYFSEVDFSDNLISPDISINLVPEIYDVSSNLTFKKYLRFHEYSKMLVSNDVLNLNQFVIDPYSNHHEDNFSFTMSCWISYNPETLGNENELVSQGLLNGFLLFAIDDENLSNSNNNTSDNAGLYFWAPGYQTSSPQIFYGSTKNTDTNMATPELSEVCNDNGAVGLRLNKEWNMVALTVDGKDCKVFVNGQLCGDYTFPNKITQNKITINGNRFNDSVNNNWLTETRTSSMDVSIADMKIYNSAFHPFFIKKYYEHDLPNFEQKNNFIINNNFACFGNDLVVQKELFVNSKSHFYEDVVTHGVTEMFNSLNVTGDVSIGSIANPREKLDIMGNIRASGNLYLGYEDVSANGIYFQGVHDDNNPQYVNTCLEERMIDTSGNSELLLFKGDDICGNNVIGDRIRIKAPNIYFDTYDTTGANGANKDTDQSRVVINQSGNLGIGVLHPTEKLDVSGKIRLLSETNNNMYIFNGNTCDVSNNGSQNIGIGANIFSDVSFAGVSNIAIGNNSQLSEKLDVSGNISIGNDSLRSNIDGNNNISIGDDSFRDKIGGSNNIAIGKSSGSNYINYPNNGEGISLGNPPSIYDTSQNLLNAFNNSSQNIFIGNNTGYSYDPSNVDFNLDYSTEYNNSIAIGHNATIAQSNSIIIGDSSNNEIKVGILTNTPSHALDVNGDVNCRGILVNGKKFGSNDVGGTLVDGDYDISGDLAVRSDMFVYKRIMFANKSQIQNDSSKPNDNAYFDNYNENNHNYDFIVQNRNIYLKNSGFDPTSNAVSNINGSNNKPLPFLLDSYDISFAYTGALDGISNPTFHIQSHDTIFDNNVTFGPSAEILALSDASFNENVEIAKNLTVKGNTSFATDASFSASTSIDANLTVFNNVAFGKNTIDDVTYTLDVVGKTRNTGDVDICGNTTITGNLYVDGSFNMNEILYKNVVETHQVVSVTERVDINNNGDSTALKVTQNGATNANGIIAEFIDGDNVANDVSGIVFRIGNNGVSEMYGNLGINTIPDISYVFDISGNTNMTGKIGFGMPGSSEPRCTIDCGNYDDAILLPRGNDSKRPSSSPQLGMIRYNTDSSKDMMEIYGKNSSGDNEWIQISSGGSVFSDNKTAFVSLNEETNNVGRNSNITFGTDNKCISTIDASGNFALAEGIDIVGTPSVYDYYKPEARFHIRDLTGQPNLPAMRFELNTDASSNTIIKSRNVSGQGQALDFETNYKKDASTYIYQQSLSIQPNGHIGIGTQSPSANANLEISNTSSADLSGNCYVNIVSDKGNSSQLRLFDDRDVSGAVVEYITDPSGDQMNLGMFRNGAQKNYFTLKSTGIGDDDFRIGIGTTNPERKFQINDTPSNAHKYAFDNNAALLIHHPANIDTPPAYTSTEDIQTMMYFTRDINDTTNNKTTMSLANIRLGSDINHNSVLDFGLFNVNDINTTTTYTDSNNDYGQDVPTVLRLKSGGQVGINVKHPDDGSALHIDKGHISIGNSNSGHGVVFNHNTDDSSKIIPTLSGDVYSLKTVIKDVDICHFKYDNTSGSPQGYIHMDNANLGIGVSVPTHKLEVSGNTKLDGTLNVTSDASFNTDVYVDGSINVTYDIDIGGTLDVTGDASFNNVVINSNKTFTVGTGSSSLGGTLDVSANATFKSNVDIGGSINVTYDTDIGGTLDVIGDSSFNNVVINSDKTFTVGTGASSIGGTLDVSANATFKSNVDIDGSINVTYDTDIGGTLDVTGDSSFNNVVINSDKTLTVGTGASSLGGTLDVSANATFKSNVYIDGSINVTHDTDIGGTLNVTGNTTIDSTNKLICGTIESNSSSKVTFNHDIELATGKKVTANQFIAVSDRNLKQNIVPIENALDKVCKMEGVHYEFISNPGVKKLGLIAQDVEKIIPEVVSENNEGTKGIDYAPIVGILIESIKELKEENRKLNEKLNHLINP